MIPLHAIKKFGKPISAVLRDTTKQDNSERFAKMYEREKERYDELLKRVNKIREQLRETDNPIQKEQLRKTLDHLERELSGIKVNMFNIQHMAKGHSVEGGMPTDLLGKAKATITGYREYLHQKEIDHPTAALAAKMGAGALAAGLGALAARKLWKWRQQRKQQGR